MTTVTLAELQAGDKIAVKQPRYNSYDPTPSYYKVLTVDRVTSSLLICGWMRFRKSDGQLMGDRYTKAEVATDEIIALNVEQTNAAARYRSAMAELNELLSTPMHRLRLNVDQVEALAACWLKVRGGGKDGELPN